MDWDIKATVKDLAKPGIQWVFRWTAVGQLDYHRLLQGKGKSIIAIRSNSGL